MPFLFDGPPPLILPERPGLVRPAPKELLRPPALALPITGFISAAPGQVTATLEETKNSISGGSTTMNIGTASSDRYVVVAIVAQSGTVTSVTVAGTSCTQLVAFTAARHTSLWVTNSAITTGTTATVTWSASGSADDCGTYSLKGAATPTSPHDSASSTANPPSASVTVPSGGAIIAVGTDGNVTTSTVSINNVDNSTNFAGSNWDAATGHSTDGTSETVSLSLSHGTTNAGVGGASWSPS